MILKWGKKILAYFGIGVTRVPKKFLFGGNKLTNVQIGAYKLKLQQDHSLLFNLNCYPVYNQNLPRLVSFVKQKEEDFSVIDIGANIGDTVVFIKNQANVPVICFEGDERYFELLQYNTAQFQDVTIYKQYLSDQTQEISVTADYSKGTGALTTQPGSFSFQVFSLDSIVEETPFLFENVRIIKIDTDGYDLKIIRGAWEFLKLKKPILFFEYDRKFLAGQDEDGFSTINKLIDIGYHYLFFYDNYGRFMTALTADNIGAIESMHNYINNGLGAFEFFDLCFFHKNDEQKAKEFFEAERLTTL